MYSPIKTRLEYRGKYWELEVFHEKFPDRSYTHTWKGGEVEQFKEKGIWEEELGRWRESLQEWLERSLDIYGLICSQPQ